MKIKLSAMLTVLCLSAGSSAPVQSQTAFRQAATGKAELGKALAKPSFANEFRDPPLFRSASHRLDVNLRAVEAETLLRSSLPQLEGGIRIKVKSYDGGFMPQVWQVDPGETIHVELVNAMGPCVPKGAGATCDPTGQLTNLHTHGLLVSPRGNSDNTNIRIWPQGVDPASLKNPATQPMPMAKFELPAMAMQALIPLAGGSDPAAPTMPDPLMADHRGSHGASLTGHGHDHGDAEDVQGHFRYEIAVPDYHPASLNWFHSHIHGTTTEQLGGGMAGILAIGAPPKAGVRIRYMALHDIQAVTGDDGKTLVGNFPQDLDMCKDTEASGAHGGDYAKGFCSGTRKDQDGDRDDTGIVGSRNAKENNTARWLFPINDQIYPTIVMAPRSRELWRLVNASPNATYQLGLSTGAKFCVLAANGVIVKPEPGDHAEAATGCAGALRTDFVMLPATRVELLVSAPKASGDKPVQFVTRGFKTGGPAVDDKGDLISGDSFPPIALAELRLGTPAASSGPQPVIRLSDVPRAESFVEKCPTDSADFNGRREIRYFTLASQEGDKKTDFDFKIGSGIGPRSPPADFVPPRPYAFGEAGARDPLVCVKWGRSELWKIENHTGELHNFHVHQLRFTVIDICAPSDDGLCQRDTIEQLGCRDASASRQTASAGSGTRTGKGLPTGTGRPRSKSQNSRPVSFGKFQRHDTIPVPCAAKHGGDVVEAGMANKWPGQAKYPGYVLIEVLLNQPEQIGSYVLHCHIMEHQERGMMGRIVVRQ